MHLSTPTAVLTLRATPVDDSEVAENVEGAIAWSNTNPSNILSPSEDGSMCQVTPVDGGFEGEDVITASADANLNPTLVKTVLGTFELSRVKAAPEATHINISVESEGEPEPA